MSQNPKIELVSRPISSNALPEKRKSIDLSNKTFFSNIKAELNSIRTDVNKLVTKDSAAKHPSKVLPPHDSFNGLAL